MKIRFSMMILILVLLSLTVPVGADDEITFRVCLSKSGVTAGFSVSEGNYDLQDFSTNWLIGEIEKGDTVTVNQEGNNLSIIVNGIDQGLISGPLMLRPKDSDDLNVLSYGGAMYRDGMTVIVDSGALLVVNFVDMEHYLYGVVGKEIGYTAGVEALKAQAVVSRTYAVSQMGANKNYDFGKDTSSQVYGGYGSEKNYGADRVIEAVDLTAGKVIKYLNQTTGKKEIIMACFHSNAGGYTENSENVWSEALPYLKAVSSPYDKYAEEYGENSGQSWVGSTYRWELVFTSEQIVQAINNYNKKAVTPINIGTFRDLRIYKEDCTSGKLTESGRVTRMELVGDKGRFSFYRDALRSLLGLKSTKFNLTKSSNDEMVVKDATGAEYHLKNLDDIHIVSGSSDALQLSGEADLYQVMGINGCQALSGTADTFTFTGQGYGHGLGMSQWGAMGMANQGFTYREIIEHYYNQEKNDGKLTIEDI